MGRSRERIQAEIASDLGFGMAALPTTTVRVGADDYTLVLPKSMAMLPTKRPAPSRSRSETSVGSKYLRLVGWDKGFNLSSVD